MTFPVYIPVGSVALHPHWVFESLAYLVGFRAHLWLRKRQKDPLSFIQRMSVVAAAASGAAFGSKLLYWLTDPRATWGHLHDPAFLMGGKSIVGGLVGGLIAVEWVKRWLGIRRATGDLFALPITLGIAIGRIGCFLSGLGDHTHGLPMSLPWGVDFGDGIRRHPTQLYEIGWMFLLAGILLRCSKQPHREGDIFKLFMVGYMLFRLFVEFIKPGLFFGGLTAIQWTCVGMLLYYWKDMPHLGRLVLEKAHA